MDAFKLGEHEARLDALAQGQDQVLRKVDALSASVYEIKLLVTEDRGFKRALVRLAAIGGSALAGIAWIVEKVILPSLLGKGD